MSRVRGRLVVAVAVAVAAVAVRRRAAAVPRRRFDPAVLGAWECEAWAAYYRREWLRVLVAAVGMVASGFRLGPWRTLVGAWFVLRANQAWAPYPDNDPDGARAYMRRFYELARDAGRPHLDPLRTAELEVEWWRVHRLHQHGAAVRAEQLTDALDALYCAVYDIPAGTAREAARLRMEAMELSDRWVEAGADRRDPLLARERRVLVASYEALLAATPGG